MPRLGAIHLLSPASPASPASPRTADDNDLWFMWIRKEPRRVTHGTLRCVTYSTQTWQSVHCHPFSVGTEFRASASRSDSGSVDVLEDEIEKRSHPLHQFVSLGGLADNGTTLRRTIHALKSRMALDSAKRGMTTPSVRVSAPLSRLGAAQIPAEPANRRLESPLRRPLKAAVLEER